MIRFVVVSVLSASLAGGGAAYPPPKSDAKAGYDKLAKETADTFLQNMVKPDVDAMIKAVEFPLLDT
jgi:hypothetical protein